MTKKAWSGRFSEDMSKKAEKFTSSIDIDGRMYKEDIQGSIAWANALKKAKVIKTSEAAKIIKGLKAILAGIEKGSIKLKSELEDIHMNVESLLIAKVGDVGKKLHTGRSRNDQVVTDLRLYLKKELSAISGLISALQKTLIKLAEENIAVIMPGYTHMQQAQPVLLSHHLMAYFEMLYRDKSRLEDCLTRIDIMPLGSGALAGTAFPIDRAALARELGFSQPSKNSMDAVSDRDFVAEALSCLSLVMMHLSRFSSELILWASQEFNYVQIGDAYSTGSSLMPQKKNPDVAELIRGKTASVYGALLSILTLMKGMPLTYNRDFQEDKGPLFNAIDITRSSLSVFTEMLSGIRFNASEMRKQMRKNMASTTMANYLVKKGLPFREAHEVTGRIVAYCEKSGKDLDAVSLWELRRYSPRIEDDIYGVIVLEKSVETCDVIGGTAKNRVLAAISEAKKRA